MNDYSELIKEIFLRNIWTYAHLDRVYLSAIRSIEFDVEAGFHTPTIERTLKLHLIMAKSAREYLKSILNTIEERFVFNYKMAHCPSDAREMVKIVRSKDVKGETSLEIGKVVSTSNIRFANNSEITLAKVYVKNIDKKFAAEVIDDTLEYLFNEEQVVSHDECRAFREIAKKTNELNETEEKYYKIAGKLEAIQNYNFHLRNLFKIAGFQYKNKISISRYIECAKKIAEEKPVIKTLDMMD